MSVKNYLNVFKEMVEKEKLYAKALTELSKKIEHPVLQSIFVGIASDSLKHSQLYEGLVKLLTSPQPVLSQKELELISREIDKHIETEAQMVKLVGELLKEVEDPRVKLVLSAIHNDEAEHHRVLISVRDNLAKREVIAEEDVWDMIWKASPWHGTPGG